MLLSLAWSLTVLSLYRDVCFCQSWQCTASLTCVRACYILGEKATGVQLEPTWKCFPPTQFCASLSLSLSVIPQCPLFLSHADKCLCQHCAFRKCPWVWAALHSKPNQTSFMFVCVFCSIPPQLLHTPPHTVLFRMMIAPSLSRPLKPSPSSFSLSHSVFLSQFTSYIILAQPAVWTVIGPLIGTIS